MQSKAKTVKEYLASLPEDRRAALEEVRKVILKNLDKDYEEGMQYGGIGYYVRRSVFPQGYHCDSSQPLPFAGLASQKNHMSVGLMCNYFEAEADKWFRAAWLETGKKLDMGKCCIRFKKIEDVALEVLGEAVRRVPAKKYIATYLAALEGRSAGKPAAKRKSKATVKGRTKAAK
ncbi:MAG: DUF1801 domain-containing protein [Phycisphaerales bacterium]|nr:DUF1801 domain-containing protein [Phycisphaerales bacterium]